MKCTRTLIAVSDMEKSIFAVGTCIFTCFFSVNESKNVVTVTSKIHGAGSVIGFILLLFVPLLVGILFFKNQNPTMGVMSIISFVLALVFFTLFVMSDKPNKGPITDITFIILL